MRAEGRQWSPGRWRWRGWAGQDGGAARMPPPPAPALATGQLGSCFHPVSHFSQQAINMHNINSLIMDKKCSKHVSCKEARSILLVTPDNKNLEPCPRQDQSGQHGLGHGYRATTESPLAFVLVNFVEFSILTSIL